MRELDRERLNRVAARLGEAALDPTAWVPLMDEICGATGTKGAVLLQSDIRTPDVPRTAGVDEMITHYFAENLQTFDFRVRGVPRLLAGAPVIVDQDFASPEEMRNHPYYNNALIPFDLLWFAGIGFWAGEALWVLCLQRSPKEGPFESDDTRILAQLSPQLTQTATLSVAIGRSVLRGINNALNFVAQPALALDRFGSVLDANEAAQALFDDEIGVKGRRLIFRDREAARAFDTFIGQLRNTPYNDVLRSAPIVVKREGWPAIIIRVVPLDGPASGPFLGARALLIFSDLAQKSKPSSQTLRNVFQLTAAEARLASIVATGISLEQAAEELLVSRETVRNQLKAVFAKTDTHKQSELVALLSRLSAFKAIDR
jgi:DNA-binding CsgD family transcriptional regulator